MKKIILCAFLFLTLSACKNPSYKIKLNINILEYEDKVVDICQFIQKIDDAIIRDHTKQENKIDELDYEVKCPNYEIKKLGKQETSITVNGIDVIIAFEVEDTKAPNIKVKNEVLKVEEGNEYFDVKNLVEISDSYDENPLVTWSGEYDIKTPGDYEIIVNAKDSSNNISTRKLIVSVSEKEIEVVETPQSSENMFNQNANKDSNTPPIENKGNNSPAVSIPSGLAPKSFLFTQGYDLVTGFDACMSYKGNANGSCGPLQGNDGFPYGYQYQP